MTLTLSGSGQENVLAEIGKEEGLNLKKAKRHAIGTAAGLAGYAVLTAMLPPVGLAALPATISFLAGALFGFELLKDGGRAYVLGQAKDDVKKDTFFDRLKQKTARLEKWHKRTDNALMGTIFGALAVVGAALLAPAVVPVATAGAIYGGMIYAGLGLISAVSFLRGSRDASIGLQKATYSAIVNDSTAPKANDNAPSAPALASAPSPAAQFDKAANDSAPKAETPVTPKNVPPAPQP
jgi:hypothetical protein